MKASKILNSTLLLRFMAVMAILALTQCTWPSPVSCPLWRTCHADALLSRPIFADPFFGYTALKCVASSPAWAHLHEVEARECFVCRDVYYEPAPATSTVVVTRTTSSK